VGTAPIGPRRARRARQGQAGHDIGTPDPLRAGPPHRAPRSSPGTRREPHRIDASRRTRGNWADSSSALRHRRARDTAAQHVTVDVELGLSPGRPLEPRIALVGQHDACAQHRGTHAALQRAKPFTRVVLLRVGEPSPSCHRDVDHARSRSPASATDVASGIASTGSSLTGVSSTGTGDSASMRRTTAARPRARS
jgi:hypothetical protein